MIVKLKAGATLTRDHNHHGLTLAMWDALAVGEALTLDTIPASLEPLVEQITAPKEARNGSHR